MTPKTTKLIKVVHLKKKFMIKKKTRRHRISRASVVLVKCFHHDFFYEVLNYDIRVLNMFVDLQYSTCFG